MVMEPFPPKRTPNLFVGAGNQHVTSGTIISEGNNQVEMRPTRQYFPSLQGLRGVSAISVLVVHIYDMALHGGFFPRVSAGLEDALSTLGNGVALFFIISGFVIPASMLRHDNARRFLIDRLLRIMPVFLIIHVLVFSIGPFIGYKWLNGIGTIDFTTLFVTNGLFVALPLGLPLGQQNSWTLTYEWAFYLFIVMAWVALARMKQKFVMAGVICLIGFVACCAFPICLYFVIGVRFAFLPLRIRLNPVVECILIPICLIGFFYCAQFVGYFLAAPFAVILFLAALQDGSLTSRCLCIFPLQYVGKVSYSLYLIHPLAMFPFQILGRHLIGKGFNPELLFFTFAIFGTAAALVLSIISYNCLEVRLRTLLTKSLSERATFYRRRRLHVG